MAGMDLDPDLEFFSEDACDGLAGLDALVADVDGGPLHPARTPSPVRVGAALALDMGTLPAGDVLDGIANLVQGHGEHPDLARLCAADGLLRRCPPGRCKHGKCLVRMAALRYDWLCSHAREAARLRAATRQQSSINMERTHGGGEKTGAQVESRRRAARIASGWIGDSTVDALSPSTLLGSPKSTEDHEDDDPRSRAGDVGDYDFDSDDGGEPAADDEDNNDDEAFLYNKAVARVAREQFVLETIAHMHDPDFLHGGDVAGTSSAGRKTIGNSGKFCYSTHE